MDSRYKIEIIDPRENSIYDFAVVDTHENKRIAYTVRHSTAELWAYEMNVKGFISSVED